MKIAINIIKKKHILIKKVKESTTTRAQNELKCQ